MIAYTKFSENEVFEDPRYNVFCNQLYTMLINQTSEDKVTSGLLLDGDVALILQGEEVHKVTKVLFSTSDAELFRRLKVSIGALNFSKISITDNRISMYFNKLYFDVRFVTTSLKSVTIDGIKMNGKADILNEKKWQ